MVEEYVGCCPDPDQFGIVLQNADMKIAEDFCRKKNLKMAPFADYIYNIPNKYQNVDKSKLIFISTGRELKVSRSPGIIALSPFISKSDKLFYFKTEK